MLLSIGALTFGGKPVLRLLITAIASIVAFLLFRDVASAIPTIPPAAEVGGRIGKALSFNTFYHQYESPRDVIIPEAHGRELATESVIGKVSLLQHENPRYVRALRTHQLHNQRYGYPMFVLRHSILETTWSKPAYILAVMLEELRKPQAHRLKWLFWVDAAAIVMNSKISLDVFLPPAEFSHFHLLTSEGEHGPNTGVFFIKVHPWSVELLSATLSFPVYLPDFPLPAHDQSALSEVLKHPHFQDNYLFVPKTWFNSYEIEYDDDDRIHPWQIKLGDLLVHFPEGQHQDERMRKYIDRAEQHLPECEVEFKNTTYPKEIETFWASLHSEMAQGKGVIVNVDGVEDLLTSTEQQLEDHREEMDNDDVRKVEEKMHALKKSLEQQDNEHGDKEALLTASTQLREVIGPLIELAKFKLTLIARAKAAIDSAEQQLAETDDEKDKNQKEALMSDMESLREILEKSPKDKVKIAKALGELETQRKLMLKAENGTLSQDEERT